MEARKNNCASTSFTPHLDTSDVESLLKASLSMDLPLDGHIRSSTQDASGIILSRERYDAKLQAYVFEVFDAELRAFVRRGEASSTVVDLSEETSMDFEG